MIDEYYAWLLDKIDASNEAYKAHELLLEHLYTHDFRYVLSMDSNRAKGGLALRNIYAMMAGLYIEDVKEGPCCILEMLIALSENMYMCTDLPTSKFFWELIDNLGLFVYDDYHFDPDEVSIILSNWMDRQFNKSGQGSIFPLPDYVDCDSRNMEIWNQMNRYLLVNYPVGDWIE